jgi:hypothetical protein
MCMYSVDLICSEERRSIKYETFISSVVMVPVSNLGSPNCNANAHILIRHFYYLSFCVTAKSFMFSEVGVCNFCSHLRNNAEIVRID